MTAASWLTAAAPAAVSEIAGQPVAVSYGDPAREYEALREGAMLVDRSERLRLTFTGDKAGEVVAGLVTNDVAGLAVGEGCYAAALTPKGKIVADVRVFALPEGLLVDASPRAAAGWRDVVRKYVNPRLARYADTSATMRDIGLFGAHSRRIVGEITRLPSAQLQVLPLYSHLTATLDAGEVTVARVPELGLEGYELLGGEEVLRELWTRAAAAGATPAGLEAWEIARVEAGRPEWGLDIDESTLPQEANLDELHAISYTKGCYTGQETVARIHFRGHVNRHLRGLRTTAARPLPAGAQLVDDTGKAVGDVRTATMSPRLGNIALAMVRREVAAGATLDCRWADGQAEVTAWPLPFPL